MEETGNGLGLPASCLPIMNFLYGSSKKFCWGNGVVFLFPSTLRPWIYIYFYSPANVLRAASTRFGSFSEKGPS